MLSRSRLLFSFASKKIGFVGLGIMGFPMASNLAKKGYDVYAFDVDQTKKSVAQKQGLHFNSNLAEIAKATSTIITMLPNSSHSQEVCDGPNGLFKNCAKGAMVIDCSTISPLVARELSEKATKQGHLYIDAPVSGGVTGAEAATLTFMVGAPNKQIFESASEYLQAMGKNFFNCERAGAGQIAKICNNMALAIEMVGVSQALALGKKLGIDDKILTNIMKSSTSRCWSVDTYNPVPGVMENVPASRNYQRGFGCELMLKDLKIAEDCAKTVGANIKLGNECSNIYEKLSQQGLGKKDFGIVFQELFKDGKKL